MHFRKPLAIWNNPTPMSKRKLAKGNERPNGMSDTEWINERLHEE